MARPQVVVEVAFNSNPNQVPQWTDVSAYVREVHTRRGRQAELDRVEAGTATVVLDNRDRRFDPSHAGGPYHGQLLPMRRIRISAIWKAAVYPLFTGFVENWGQTWPGGLDALCQVEAVDGFKVLALQEIDGTLPAESSGARIQRLLDATGISGTFVDQGYWVLGDEAASVLGSSTKVASELEAFRLIDAGQSDVQGETVLEPALSCMRRVEEAERGLLFIDAAGRLVYQDRHFRLLHRRTTSGTLANRAEDGEALYDDLVVAYDDTRIYNEVRAGRRGGAEVVVNDVASRGKYLTRRLEAMDLILTHDNEVHSLAHWLLNQYKDPDLRADRVGIGVLDQEADVYAFALARDISDRVTLKWRAPQGGLLTKECYIEAVQWDITDDTWTVNWQLSPALTTPYWILADAAWGVLGDTTRLAS